MATRALPPAPIGLRGALTVAPTARERAAAAIAALERSGWRCGQGIALDLPNETSARLAWDAWDACFDGDGALVAPLSMRYASTDYRGGWCRIQAAFADAGLAVRVGDDTAELVDGAVADHDLARICAALRLLRRRRWFAEPCWRVFVSYGWEDAAGDMPERAGTLFWTSQSHEGAFDRDGNLSQEWPMSAPWEGDAAAAARAFARAGVDGGVHESGRIVEIRGRRPPLLTDEDALDDLVHDARAGVAPDADWLAATTVERALAACQDGDLLTALAFAHDPDGPDTLDAEQGAAILRGASLEQLVAAADAAEL